MEKRRSETRTTFAARQYCSRTCAIRAVHGRPMMHRLATYRAENLTTGCWEWTACRNSKGYGRTARTPEFGRECLVHRLSWLLHRGAIPAGTLVLHHCDNPSCFNPDHLFLGTNADNVADKVKKGRGARLSGANNPRAKLSELDVAAIRADSRPIKTLADMYNVAAPTIARIRNGTGWRPAGGEA